MKKWNDIEKGEFPDSEDTYATPVYILWEGNEIEAWYRNPSMDECWFESNTGALLEGVTKWRER